MWRIAAPVILLLGGLASRGWAQAPDSMATRTEVRGAVAVTNNGISTVPSFSLGRPAAIFDLGVSRGKASFEPQFRFALDGKPWSFLFWGRYRLVEGERLRVTVGAHPAVSFRTTAVATAGAPTELIVARRFYAGEVSASYALAPSLGVGPYYLYSYGVERNVTRHTNLVALRGTLSGVRLAARYSLRLAPQIYYLRTDDRAGTYLYSAATLARRGLPLTLSVVANQPLETRVQGGEGFVWNVSLQYAFE